MTSPPQIPPPRQEPPRTLRGLRAVALTLITLLVVVATAVAFIESYEGLYRWALDHGLSGVWARVWPLQVDAFIAVGELSLFIAIVDRWKSHTFPWAVTAAGLAFSVWGNVGRVTEAGMAYKVTAAVPPLAAAAGLMVGLQVLKRIVAARDTETETETAPAPQAVKAEPTPPDTTEPVQPATPVTSAPPVKASSTDKTGRRTRRRSATAPPDVDDLMPLGWRIAADFDRRGQKLTRDRLKDAVRESGQSISTDRARALLARLRTEAPADPVDPTPDRTSPQFNDERDATPTRQSPAAPRHPVASTTHEVTPS